MNLCIKSESFKTTSWAGGNTTQLFIFPQTADYKSLNFNFRISTANIEALESEFSSLPTVSRKLMVLDGEIEIKHEKHHQKKLKKFDQDAFEGDWKTSSFGRGTDFNLMCTSGTTGQLQAVQLHKKERLAYTFEASANWLFIYAFKGKLNIMFDEIAQTLNQGDLFVVKASQKKLLNFQALKNCELVFVNISCPVK